MTTTAQQQQHNGLKTGLYPNPLTLATDLHKARKTILQAGCRLQGWILLFHPLLSLLIPSLLFERRVPRAGHRGNRSPQYVIYATVQLPSHLP